MIPVDATNALSVEAGYLVDVIFAAISQVNRQQSSPHRFVDAG